MPAHNSEKIDDTEISVEKPNSFWYRVYLGVLIFTVLVISLLALFSNYFS